MRLLVPVFLLSLCLVPSPALEAGQENQTAQPPIVALTNQDIQEMVKAGLSSDIVIAKIKVSRCMFDTSPNALKELKTNGIADAVILAMVQAPIETQTTSKSQVVTKTGVITCVMATDIPAYPSPEVSATAIANPKCGEKVFVLDYHDTWVKIETKDGTIGWIAQYFLSKEFWHTSSTPANSTDTSVATGLTNSLSPNVLRATAWRAIPWATTSYWQQQGNANTSCTGSGSWLGDTWQGNASCNTVYTPAQSIPITWQHFTIYNLVETSDSWMVLGCTRNWNFSKCSYLIPGSLFAFENKSGKISVKGQRAGKAKEQTLDLDIISMRPKTSH